MCLRRAYGVLTLRLRTRHNDVLGVTHSALRLAQPALSSERMSVTGLAQERPSGEACRARRNDTSSPACVCLFCEVCDVPCSACSSRARKLPPTADLNARSVLRSQVPKMSTLSTACAAAMQSEGVAGVMCVDSQGLCLHSEGKVPEASAGAIAAMTTQSSALLGSDAVVSVESPQGKILLSRCEGATVAIFMVAKAAPAN